MSFDLMVFDADVAPKSRQEFFNWYEEQAEWDEPHSYDDPQVAAAKLRHWFTEMYVTFFPLNGPLSSQELPEDESSLADYCIGKNVIYVAFSWSRAEEALDLAFKYAVKHGVGFFYVSSDGSEVYYPTPDGGMVLLHSDRDGDA